VAVMVVKPATEMTLVSVKAPPVVTVRFPDNVKLAVSARTNAVVSFTSTLVRVPPELKATVPEKVLLLSRVILRPLAAVKVAAPSISNTPASVISPPAVAVTA